MSVLSATLFAAIVVDKLILPVPSNDTPEAVTSPVRAISLPVAKAVAVAEFPVQLPLDPLAFPVTLPVMFPENVPDNTSVLELNVNPLALFGAKSPVAAVTNNGKHVVSVDSSATVTFVEVVAVALFPVQLPAEPEVFPVTFPVRFPVNAVAITVPDTVAPLLVVTIFSVPLCLRLTPAVS